jgi:hypothetical protein
MDEFEQAQYAEVLQRYKTGANWFYWIAGLTIITSVIAIFGGGWRFLISLGSTQLIDGIAEVFSAELGSAPKIIAFVLDLIVTGVFVLFGYLSNQKYLWAYMAGMVVFLLDGLVNLVVVDWIGVIVHVVVLFFMFRGYQAGRELMSLEQAMAAKVPDPVPQPEAAV